jgi:hypothetical protein
MHYTCIRQRHVAQQYKGNSLLRFHGNNGYANALQRYTYIACLVCFGRDVSLGLKIRIAVLVS